MRLEELLPTLRAGVAIRRWSWPAEYFLTYLSREDVRLWDGRNVVPIDNFGPDLLAEDWGVVE
jgi:hypothetical protein